ncbi:hypothetical protein DFH09DRAFT_1334082 [Mycena vulgaris]|nr:hypothetical protein DFH09DRAFT_1334082 [Mycena vulgaris]
MERPSSPFQLSPGSSCSSTLIMTPVPLPPLRRPAPKGPLQPHITNLPRRRRAPMANLCMSAPPRSASGDSTYAPSPIQIPSLPVLPFPISGGGVPMQRETLSVPSSAPRGPVQPAHGNVPRRTKPLSAAQLRARRRRERCIQELGRSSGVFLAFECESAEEEAEDRFDAVVRISAAREGDAEEGKDLGVDDKGGGAVLRFTAPGTRDDGVPCLQPAQLRAACAFVSGHRAEGRRVLITAPRAHAVDALSVGVCCIRSDAEVTRFMDEDADDDVDGDADAERVHRLVMRWHDLPAEDAEDDDGYDGGGLKEEWRGLLSRDGMDYLAAVVGCPTQDSPPPPSRSPSP